MEGLISEQDITDEIARLTAVLSAAAIPDSSYMEEDDALSYEEMDDLPLWVARDAEEGWLAQGIMQGEKERADRQRDQLAQDRAEAGQQAKKMARWGAEGGTNLLKYSLATLTDKQLMDKAAATSERTTKMIKNAEREIDIIQEASEHSLSVEGAALLDESDLSGFFELVEIEKEGRVLLSEAISEHRAMRDLDVKL